MSTRHFENLFSVTISKFLPCLVSTKKFFYKRIARKRRRYLWKGIFHTIQNQNKNTVKFPLSVFLIVLPEIALYIVHPHYNPPWLLYPKIGPDLWMITRFECVSEKITFEKFSILVFTCYFYTKTYLIVLLFYKDKFSIFIYQNRYFSNLYTRLEKRLLIIRNLQSEKAIVDKKEEFYLSKESFLLKRKDFLINRNFLPLQKETFF